MSTVANNAIPSEKQYELELVLATDQFFSGSSGVNRDCIFHAEDGETLV